MSTLRFANNSSTTLSGSINNTQTAITVTNGASFPTLTVGQSFYATMYESAGNPAVEINIEIVKVTATIGNNWTIVRGQEGTSARNRDGVSTCYIELRLTAAGAQEMLQKSANLSDRSDASVARTSLGLGSIATQSASNVAITGGSISGVTFETLDSTTTIADNVDATKKVQFQVSGVTTGTTRTLTVPNASGTMALTSDLSSYQPLDSDLTAVAGLAANGLIARTGTGTMAVRALTQPAAGITVTNGDGVSGNPTLALANDLLGVENLSTIGFVRRTAADTWSASAIVDGDLPSALTGKTYNGITPTANATGFSLAGGTTSKTLTVNNSITLAGTDGTTITLPATNGTVALNNQTFFIGTTSVAINRTTGALSLTGVSIDGSAGSAASATSATTATNIASGVLGSLPYQSAAATTALLAPNTTTTRNFLRMTGTGTVGAAPAWDTVTKTDVGLSNVENTALSTWAGSANITTLGTVATGTWNATTIGIAKGGTGQTTAVAAFDALAPTTTLGDVIFHDGTDNVRLAGNTTTNRRFLRQTGTGTVSAAPAWDALVDGDIPSALTGKTYNGITPTANATGFSLAGGTTSKTLTVSNTLTLAGTDSSTLNIGAGGTLGSAAFTASTAYAPAAGSSSITTVGTIGSGTWQGSAIGISYGGTGQTSKTAAFDALAPTTTLGDTMYYDGTDVVRLAGSTSASKRFLTQTGNGTISAAPGWNAIADADVPSALTGKTYNGLTLTANAIGFQIAGGTTSKTLVVSNNLTFSGTDGSTLNIGGGGTLGTGAYATIANYAPLASPALTGTPTSTTAAVDTNTTQIATTAFVVGQAASATPLVNGTAAVGTSLRYARGDHVHPTDTSRAPLASPTFTGTPAAPTAAVDTNTTQLATTAYVVGQGYLKSATAASTYAPLTGTGTSGTWGINITGSAGSAASLSSNTSYMVSRGGVAQASIDTATSNGFYVQTNPTDSSAVLVFDAGGSTGIVQQRFSYQGTFEWRNRTDNTTWTAWRTLLHSANYTSYAPSLTGSGASGTWGINVTGNAGTAYGLNVHTGRNNEADKVVRTDSSGYLQVGYINSSSGNENNASNPPRVWGTNGSDDYMRTYQTSSLNVGYATNAGNITSTSGKLGYSVSALGVGYNGQGGPDVRNQGSGAAMMAFHREGAYAVNVGLDTDNVFRIGGWSDGANTYRFSADTSGNFVARGNVTAYGSPSDIKLKENISPLTGALKGIEKLNGYRYNYKGRTDTLIGVIAQEVEQAFPELVYEFTNESGTETSKAVRYEHLTAVLIEAVKELSARVKALEGR